MADLDPMIPRHSKSTLDPLAQMDVPSLTFVRILKLRFGSVLVIDRLWLVGAFWTFFFAFASLAQIAWGQETGAPIESERAALIRQIETFHSEIIQLREEVNLLRQQRDLGAVEASAASYANLRSFHEHQIRLRDQAQAKLSWHLHASYAMAVVVVLVVLFGLWLAYIEVRRSLIASTNARAYSTDEDPAPNDGQDQGSRAPEHKLVLSSNSVQITSAITGVVILVISLGFLYLFLQEVYRLEPQDWTTVSTPQGNDTD